MCTRDIISTKPLEIRVIERSNLSLTALLSVSVKNAIRRATKVIMKECVSIERKRKEGRKEENV